MKLVLWEYVDAELVLHVLETKLALPAMQLIIDAYVELLVLQHHNVQPLVKLVSRICVCAEHMQPVLLQNQFVTLPIMSV